MGDSHAKRYYEGLASHFKRAFPKLNLESSEKVYFDKGSPGTPERLAQVLRCSTCRNRGLQYIDNDTQSNYSLLLELVASLSISLPITHRFSAEDIERQHLENMTYSEYIFKRYFKKKGFPDVLLMCPPFHHTILQSNVTTAKREIIDYQNLVKSSVPNTTKVLWVTAITQFDDLKEKRWQNRTYQGLKANEKISILNHFLFDSLQKDIISNDSSMLGFLDLMDASKDLHDWSLDGVHLDQKFYDVMSSYILDVICADRTKGVQS